MRHFCTLFNSYYQYHAITLYHSLAENHNDFKVYCLCMDDDAYHFIQSKAFANLIPVNISEVEQSYPELVTARNNRSMVEYFFTSTPAVCKYLLENVPGIDEIVYLDADLYFFNSPEIVFEEIGKASVSIIPHRFQGINRFRNIFGYYNVGWVSFKKDAEGKACLDDWYKKCVDWCYDKLERHRYADQKYLNEWPKKFKNVCIIKNVGANTAPWNIGNYKVTKDGNKIYINDSPLVFYHYASLKYIEGSFYTTCSSYFTRLSNLVNVEIYKHYLEQLHKNGFVPKNNLRQKKDVFTTLVRRVIRKLNRDYVNVDWGLKIKKNILCVLHLPPPIHGAAVMGKLVKESQLINSHFDNYYVNLTFSKNLDKISKTSFSKFLLFFKILFEILNNLITNKIDLVYYTLSSNPPALYKDLFYVGLIKLFNKKIVFHHHNKGFSKHSSSYINKLIYRFIFNKSRSIILSENLYEDMSSFIGRDRVYVLPNGIPPCQNTIIQNKKQNRILFVSNMLKSKGVVTLLRACTILKNKNIDFRCDFVGEWMDFTQLEFIDYLKKNNLDSNVFAHGSLFGKEKDQFYHEASIFVFPTEFETFGLVLLEAMQHSLPIIATKEGAIPEIVIDNLNGYLVNIGDSEKIAEYLESLINNPALIKGMGEESFKLYNEKYTLQEFEEKFNSTLDSILT